MSDNFDPENHGWLLQRSVPMRPEFFYSEDRSEDGVIKRLARSERSRRRWQLQYTAKSHAAAGWVESFFERIAGPVGVFDWVAPKLLADPDAAPVIDAVSGGNQGSRTCHVRFAWRNGYGITLPSARATVAVPSDWLLRVTLPPWPRSVTHAVIYATQGAAGTEQEQVQLTNRVRIWTQPNASLLLLTASVQTVSAVKELLQVQMDGTYDLVRGDGTAWTLNLTLAEV